MAGSRKTNGRSPDGKVRGREEAEAEDSPQITPTESAAESAADAEPVAGPECRTCGCRHLPVHATRRHGSCIVRIRYCRNCGARLVTREKAE